MVRRLKLHNKSTRKPFSVSDTGGESLKSNSQGFALRFAGGAGMLVLEHHMDADWGGVTRLEMKIPSISFPFDVSGGVDGLAQKRLELCEMEIFVSLSFVESVIRDNLDDNSWISNTRISIESGYVCILADYGPGDARIPVSMRLVPRVQGYAVYWHIENVLGYGPLPGPLLNIAAVIVTELFGGILQGTQIRPPDPIREVLLEVLVPRGWRVPSYDDVVVADVVFHSDRVQLRYVVRSRLEKDAYQPDMALMRRLEELRAMQPADVLLAKGELEEAREVLQKFSDQTPENIAVVTRMAMIDLLAPSQQPAVAQQLMAHKERNVLDRSGLCVLAHAAAVGEDSEVEIEVLEALFSQACPLEKYALAMRMAVLMVTTDPLRVVSYLEKAASVRRDESELLFTLIQLQARLGNAERVDTLVERWIGLFKDNDGLCDAYCDVADLYYEELEDFAASSKYYELASLLEPDNENVTWGLSLSLQHTGDGRRAIAGFEKLLAKYQKLGDMENQGRCHGAIGEVWIQQGEPELAIARLRESLTNRYDVENQLLLARAFVAVGRIEEGLRNYEEALGKGRDYDATYGKRALTVARLYISRLADFSAAERWIDEARKVDSVRDEAAELERQVLEQQGNWEKLASVLEQNLIEARVHGESGGNAEDMLKSVISLVKAKKESGDLEKAFSLLHNALERYPESLELLDLSVQVSRERGDYESLNGALKKLYELEPVNNRRGAWALELGQLGLSRFDNAHQARKYFESAVALNMGLGANQGLVEALELLGDEEALVQQLTRLVDMYLEAAEKDAAAQAMLRLSQIYQNNEQLEDAAGWMNRALPGLDDNRRAAVARDAADVYLQLERFDDARRLYHSARHGQGDDLEAALGEARASLALGDYERAYEAAVAAGSGPVELRVEAARIMAESSFRVDREAEAVDILLRLSENEEEQTAIGLLLLGGDMALSVKKDFSTAGMFYEKVLAINPNSERARNKLMRMYEENGNRRQIAEGLVRFIEFSGDPVSDFKRAAEFFMVEREFDRAVSALEEAMEASVDNELIRMLTSALKSAGRSSEIPEVLEPFAQNDRMARQMLIQHFMDSDDPGRATPWLRDYREETDEGERLRLMRLSELLFAADDSLAGAACLMDATGYVGDSEADASLYARVLEVARSQNHPQLFARAVDAMANVVSMVERDRLLLQLALMYYETEHLEDASLVLERLLFSRLPMAELLEVVHHHPQFMQLIQKVDKEAGEREEWELQEQLLTMQLDGVGTVEQIELLNRRAKLRESRLGDENGAVDDWLRLFDMDALQEVRLHKLENILYRANRLADLLRVQYDGALRNPEDGEGLLSVAELARELEDTTRQVKVLELFVQYHRNHRDVLKELVELYAEQGAHQKRAVVLESLALNAEGDEKIDLLVKAARIFMESLDDPERALLLFKRAAELSRNEPDVLLGLADAGWFCNEHNLVTSSIERLRLVAPHLNMDPQRELRFAMSLVRTGQWPKDDIRELVQRIVPRLEGDEQQSAQELLDAL